MSTASTFEETTPLLRYKNNSRFTNKTVLKWNNLTFSVPNPKNEDENIKILDNVSGYANNGELLGIIGISGSGKTTLLNMLSGRMSKLDSLKSISAQNDCINGIIQYKEYIGYCNDKLTCNVLNNNIAYVLQDDMLYEEDTVQDAIVFSSVLKLKNKAVRDRISIAHTIIKEKVKYTCIGSIQKRGVSGGEKKRVSIGMELVTSPDIILLDEATTGLDNVNAYEIMLLLKQLTKQNKCVICTIHQPSYNIYKLLDRIIILSNGKIIYQGYKQYLIKYLNSINWIIPKYTNITDYILHKIKENSLDFSTKWEEYKLQNCNYSLEIKQLLKLSKIDSNNNITRNNVFNDSYYSYKFVSLKLQFYQLFVRSLKFTYRNKYLFVYRIITILICSILEFLIWPYYHSSKVNNYNRLINRTGSIKYALWTMLTVSICSHVLTIPLEKHVFEKERINNLYYSSIWFIVKSIIELIICCIETFIICFIISFLCNFNILLYDMYVIMLLMSINSSSIGFSIGLFTPNIDYSVMLAILKITVMLGFSGYFLNAENIISVFSWYKYINPLYFSYNMFCIKEFNNINSTLIKEYLNDYGMYENDYYLYLFGLIIAFVLYRLIGYVVLVYKNGI